MKRIAVLLIGLATLLAACDRIIELSPPPPDGSSFDGGLDGQPDDDSGLDGGALPDADEDAGIPFD